MEDHALGHEVLGDLHAHAPGDFGREVAVGQAGDLVASLLKRDAGMKDYSRAIPGFGGVMDLADSPLLVAPVAYWLLKILSA